MLSVEDYIAQNGGVVIKDNYNESLNVRFDNSSIESEDSIKEQIDKVYKVHAIRNIPTKEVLYEAKDGRYYSDKRGWMEKDMS